MRLARFYMKDWSKRAHQKVDKTANMNDLTPIINIHPYSISQKVKEEIYLNFLLDLTKHHLKQSSQYKKIIDVLGIKINSINSIEDIPFIPVRLFKDYDLLSVDRSEVVKTMTSSGTSGQSVSKIFLDKTTASNQTKVLTKIVSSFIGGKRLPMLVVDSSAIVKDRTLFSARGAGVLGFSMLGYDVTYALDENMGLNIERVQAFLRSHGNEQILVFGFTFIVWQHFYNELKKYNIRLELDQGIMIHGGGWKKLADQAVDNETFKSEIKRTTGISKVYNYYGMVEQTGSIFMECEKGFLHSSLFSDVLIRDFKDFSLAPSGVPGLIQLLSLLPQSYPGHSIITEDIGEIVGIDDCFCGRMGKYFRVHGRIKNSETRGCSDAYESRR